MLCINSLKAGSFDYKRFYTPVINRFYPEVIVKIEMDLMD